MLFYRTDKIYSKVSAYPQINWSFPLLRAQIISFFLAKTWSLKSPCRPLSWLNIWEILSWWNSTTESAVFKDMSKSTFLSPKGQFCTLFDPKFVFFRKFFQYSKPTDCLALHSFEGKKICVKKSEKEFGLEDFRTAFLWANCIIHCETASFEIIRPKH